MLVGLVLLFGGVLLVNGAMHDQHPWNPILRAFGAAPLPAPGSGTEAMIATTPEQGIVIPNATPIHPEPRSPTGAILSARQVYRLARQVGFSPTEAAVMTSIAYRESRFRPSAVNAMGGATGLWQIYPGGAQYLDPVTNARAARQKFLASQASGFSGYRPWFASGGVPAPWSF